jgi:hypothetical protein
MLATKTCDSRVGSVMDCHTNRHADTMKKVQLSVEVVPLIKDTHIGMVLLLVELAEILVNHVLGVPSVAQSGQEGDQDSWKTRRITSPSPQNKLRHGTWQKQTIHLKQRKIRVVNSTMKSII